MHLQPALQGKVAVVTGGGRGIGRAIALELARRGADVVVNYVQGAEQAAAVVVEIEALGRRALAVQADVGTPSAATVLIAAAVEGWGRLDILVNNAGITRDALLMRMSDAEWEAVLRTNLTGVFYTCRAAARPLLRQRAGRIINIASVSGLLGQAGQANYAAAKAGLIGFTKSLARELAPKGVTANVVAPGFIPTALNATLAAEWRGRLQALIPLGRFGGVADVAHAVAFLASDEAAYITGVVLPVDGGLSM